LDDKVRTVVWKLVRAASGSPDDGAEVLVAVLEQLLAEGTDEAIEIIATQILETVGNIVSHADIPIDGDDVWVILGPRARVVWRCLDLLYSAVDLRLSEIESFRAASSPEPMSRLSVEDAASAESVELKGLIHEEFRVAGDHLVGVDDLLGYEMLVGNWLIPVVKIGLAPLRAASPKVG